MLPVLRTFLPLAIICGFFAFESFGQCGSLAISTITTTPVSCNGGSDGAIVVDVTGGSGPFTYSNGSGGTPLTTTGFATSNTVSNSSAAPTSVWWSPGTCGSGVYFQHSASVGCPAGSAVFNGGSATFASCFIRSPQVNMNNIDFVTITFDVTHSYNASRPNDRARFYIWVNGGYRAVPITINGVAGTSGSSYLNFDQARTCELVTITFDISSIPSGSRSDFLFYIEPSCGYSLCNTFQMVVDNISIAEGAAFQSSNSFTGLPAGNYNITVQDANGCTLTYANNPVTVTQPTALVANVSHTNPTTVGGTNGKAWVTASGGTLPYNYQWNNGVSGSDTISNLSAATFCVTVTDANNCTVAACGTVTNPTCNLAISSVGKMNATCSPLANGSFTITTTGANGAVEYSINGGTTWQSTNSFTGLAAGNYTVQVRDAAGCTANASGNPQVITAPQVMSLNFAATSPTTIGGADGSINLTVNGGSAPRTYQWSTGANTEDLSGLSAGQYCVTVTDNSGCTITGCGNVSNPTCSLSVTSVVANNPVCNGGNGSITITTSGALGAVEYSINGGSTWQASGSFTSVATGSYTVQVRDAAGCTANAPANPYTLTQPTAIGLNFAATPVSTAGGSDGAINLTVSNAAAPLTFNWSNGAVTEDLTGLTAGQYCVTVTDNNGCTATGCENISQPGCNLAITNVTKTNATCFGANNGSIAITTTGGVGNVEYSINGGSTWAASGVFNNLAAGNYNVQVRDGNGCSVIANNNPYVVSQPTEIILSTTITNASQNGASDGAIDLSVSGGTPPYTYNWSNTAQTEDIANLAAGNYCVTVTDANGCDEVTCGNVTQPGGSNCAGFSITNVTTTQPNCPGETGTITVSISGGQNPILYSIDSGATFQNGLNQFTVSGGTYNVLVRDNNGCQAVYSNNPVIITTPQGINPVVTANGSELSVTNVGTSYQWLYGGNTIANADSTHYTAIANGVYSVQVTDANGCVYLSNLVTLTGVGIAEIANLQWQLWPNPTEQFVSYSLTLGTDAKMEVYSADGRLVLSHIATQAQGKLDLSELAGGVYHIRLITPEGHAIKRVVKY